MKQHRSTRVSPVQQTQPSSRWIQSQSTYTSNESQETTRKVAHSPAIHADDQALLQTPNKKFTATLVKPAADVTRKTKRYSLPWIIGLIIFGLVTMGCIVGGIVALLITINQSKTTTTSPIATVTTTTTTITTTTSSSSSSSTTSTSTTTTSLGCSPSPVPITTIEYANTIPPQCVSYLTSTDGTRQIAYTTMFPTCDSGWPFSSNSFIWVRFQGAAGTTMMSSAVTVGYCGTTYPGWYAGQYPSTFYSTATSIACFNDGVNTCQWCQPVKVTNCEDFYVFALLAGPFCNTRYCSI